MNKSESIKELAAALSKAQGQMRGAIKDASNPFFKSKYADLASVWDAIREPLATNGLSVIQTVGATDDGTPFVDTTLAHASGEWVGERLTMKPVKSDPQGIGSVITYMRRYGLQSITGVAPEDDDGNAASGKDEVKPTVKIPEAQKKEFYTQACDYLASGDEVGLQQIWSEYDNEEKVVLWGMFNSQQRSAMKKLTGADNGVR